MPTPVPTPTPTPRTPNATSYQDDFASTAAGAVPAGWSVAGANAGWAVSSTQGGPAYVHNGWSSSTAVIGDSWADSTVTATISFSAWSSESDGIAIRYTGPKQFYAVKFVNGTRVIFGRNVNDGTWSGTWTTLASAPLAYGTASHTVTITAHGTSFTVAVDGVTTLTATDGSIAAGSVGLVANAPMTCMHLNVM